MPITLLKMKRQTHKQLTTTIDNHKVGGTVWLQGF
jgi:hypothetical protein